MGPKSKAPARYETVPEALRVPGKKLKVLCNKYNLHRRKTILPDLRVLYAA